MGKTLLSRLLRQTAHIRTAHFSLHTKRRHYQKTGEKPFSKSRFLITRRSQTKRVSSSSSRQGREFHPSIIFSPSARGRLAAVEGGGDRRVATQPWISTAAAAAAAASSHVRNRCRNPHPILEGWSGNELYRSRVKV